MILALVEIGKLMIVKIVNHPPGARRSLLIEKNGKLLVKINPLSPVIPAQRLNQMNICKVTKRGLWWIRCTGKGMGRSPQERLSFATSITLLQ
jgi:hypothetical protein